MQSPLLPKRTLGAPRVGERAAFTRTLTEADTALFIGVTWDVNPYHTDEQFAAQTPFERRIAPGLLTASLLTHLGGMWAFLATEMQFTFVAPVFVGDTVTAVAEVVEFDETRGRVRLACHVSNTADEVVLRATIVGYPGRFAQ